MVRVWPAGERWASPGVDRLASGPRARPGADRLAWDRRARPGADRWASARREAGTAAVSRRARTRAVRLRAVRLRAVRRRVARPGARSPIPRGPSSPGPCAGLRRVRGRGRSRHPSSLACRWSGSDQTVGLHPSINHVRRCPVGSAARIAPSKSQSRIPPALADLVARQPPGLITDRVRRGAQRRGRPGWAAVLL